MTEPEPPRYYGPGERLAWIRGYQHHLTITNSIAELLNEQVPVEGSEEMTLYQRVHDVVTSLESWQALAIVRLHEIHNLRTDLDDAKSRIEPDASLEAILDRYLPNGWSLGLLVDLRAHIKHVASTPSTEGEG